MKASQYFAVAAQQVTLHPVHVIKIEGQFLGNTADRFLQVFDSIDAPAANAVPLRQWPIAQGAQFFQTFSAGELALTLGLYIAVSSADGTFTASADTMDLTVELTDPEALTGVAYGSDLNTAANKFTIWADGAGLKKLFALEADGTGLAFDSYLMVCAQDSAVDGSLNVKVVANFPLPIGKTYLGLNKLTFGKDGLDLHAVDPTTGAVRTGCYIYISKKQGLVSVGAGNNAKIRAEYK